MNDTETQAFEKCRDCKFWEYFDDADDADGATGGAIGSCKRFPPVPFVENAVLADANGLKMRAWTPRQWAQPITGSLDWCGEYARKVAA